MQRGTTSWFEAFSRVFGYSKSSRTIRQSIGLPKTPQDVKNFFGIGDGFIKAWQGAKWTISRDAVAYGVFFAAFDVSRRTGLAVKVMTTERVTGRKIVSSDEVMATPAGALLTPLAPTSARLAQAVCLVTGGISASLLAEYVSRPFRILEDAWKTQERTASGLSFRPSPTHGSAAKTGRTRPFNGRDVRPRKLVSEIYHSQGVRGFFRNPADLHPLKPRRADAPPTNRADLSTSTKRSAITQRLSRLGWRLVGVGPWGFGFLVFAYLGGEV